MKGCNFSHFYLNPDMKCSKKYKNKTSISLINDSHQHCTSALLLYGLEGAHWKYFLWHILVCGERTQLIFRLETAIGWYQSGNEVQELTASTGTVKSDGSAGM